MASRSGEDTISVLFNSLEELAKSSSKMNKRIMKAFYLLLFWLGFALFLWFFAVIDLNIFDILSYMLLIAIVIIVMIYLVDIREKLANVVSRYQVYEYLQKMDLKIPPGNSEIERFINYLNENFQFEKRINERKGKIYRDYEISGIKFDLYTEIKGKAMGKTRGIKSYSFYLKKLDEPKLEEIKNIIEIAKKNSKKNKLEIGRIVVLSKEIDDNVYNYIVNLDVPFQIVMEMEDGTYDFIPFIGPRPDLLP